MIIYKPGDTKKCPICKFGFRKQATVCRKPECKKDGKYRELVALTDEDRKLAATTKSPDETPTSSAKSVGSVLLAVQRLRKQFRDKPEKDVDEIFDSVSEIIGKLL